MGGEIIDMSEIESVDSPDIKKTYKMDYYIYQTFYQ